jgi:hypothetical protein
MALYVSKQRTKGVTYWKNYASQSNLACHGNISIDGPLREQRDQGRRYGYTCRWPIFTHCTSREMNVEVCVGQEFSIYLQAILQNQLTYIYYQLQMDLCPVAVLPEK